MSTKIIFLNFQLMSVIKAAMVLKVDTAFLIESVYIIVTMTTKVQVQRWPYFSRPEANCRSVSVLVLFIWELI